MVGAAKRGSCKDVFYFPGRRVGEFSLGIFRKFVVLSPYSLAILTQNLLLKAKGFFVY
uniref:Uncharacterized protein n=1 Tax=Parascaris univalens TaxID=6257 RepID=A0A915C5B6_PARUN